ncbi:DNA repair protein rhp57 [Coemansia sp. RSA 2523]|nr:DNA repair protein rhp57 [Coemansia sp. RSA 1824]KAJ1811104.1 DNA repair protein rhp57 [Coemansia sp. RSA 2523]KAJ2126580.1 DNA repair protein rhp57 [Coemansia sp. RSA 921]KAJ2130628.1 DNA repair protein rhp57 [Coemansia sp. RSA 788]KAJ2140935.1 DNA repair protein rhp57 [Coemansia sp. RSA 564]KAJ2155017.1 DNA repair protein rhp57 [Coemansia sp. RSA 637]KAJ2169757.1 DNA repair protein rhp57 [Coemansia sp. RSA 562]KAJ2174585.1 DNA repair protein rhp57 [Coemansia sp. RSA 560]KAJ2182194.1 DN
MYTPTDDEQALVTKCMAKVGSESPQECILMPYTEFERTTGLDTQTAQRAWSVLSQLVYAWEPNCILASTHNEQWITTGCDQIDALLGNGIRVPSVVEIVGESASGKTQLCLQLAISAQLLRGPQEPYGHVVYVCTEGAFPAQRLAAMADARASQMNNPAMSSTQVMRRIQVAELDDMETMFHALSYKLPALLSTQQVRLVVIDSIAAHLRFDMEGTEPHDFYKQRSSRLMQLGARLKQWAHEYKCAIVCVNQVKDVFGVQTSLPVDGDGAESEFKMVRGSKAPALGAVWASVVNARVMLHQRRGMAPNVTHDAEHEVPSHLLRTRRWIENVFSPWAPPAQCEVTLGDHGFTAL